MEEEIRQAAISRYLQGEKPKSIYTSLKRTKPWFFKWVNRYKTGQKEWFIDLPRSPRNCPTQISEIDTERIIETRRRLDSERFAQIGASAIKWELSKSGFDFPSDRTINRVLKKEGLVKKKVVCSQGC